MNAIKTIVSLFLRITKTANLRGWKVAFLCGGLAAMGRHREKMRIRFIRLLDGCANGGDVEMDLKVSGKQIRFLLRLGNVADYLIGGELVWGAYSRPHKTPDFIVDGGANIGMFSILAHAYFPAAKIICYEPDRNNLAQLEKNMAVNGIRAEIVQKALWSKETTLFYHADASYTGYVDENPPGFAIACVTAHVQDGCWLKLDIEGGEYEVLPEILARGVRPSIISMEIHSNNLKGAELVRLLEKSGYRLQLPHDPKPDCVNIVAELQ
jgi:FkbM family methyltransferase